MKRDYLIKSCLTLWAVLAMSVGTFAQQITVNGVVQDTQGEPIVGANVLIKGTAGDNHRFGREFPTYCRCRCTVGHFVYRLRNARTTCTTNNECYTSGRHGTIGRSGGYRLRTS